MPVPLLDLFKYLVIGIIWLIFLRVIRVVWVEVKAGTLTSTAETKSTVNSDAKMVVGTQVVSGTQRPPTKKPEHVRKFSLNVLDGPYKGQTYVLTRENLIGRFQGCSIMISDDTFASSKHARIVVDGGVLWIEDVGSTNGTRVNHEIVNSPLQLSVGDVISVGKTQLVVVEE